MYYLGPLKNLIPGGQTEYIPIVILIQMNFVLSVLTFKPEIELKISNIFKAACKE